MENIYKFERIRRGNKTVSPYGEKYGPYLYRNIKTNQLIASWDKPTRNNEYLYSSADIGLLSDALLYYKNV